jgi:energy-converting hydrogenase Eha subunit E
MGWNDQIFNYCERAYDPAFWAEPLNALSNAAFLLAALSGWRRLANWERSHLIPSADKSVLNILLVLVASVGIGSFIFHTFATRWALLADVLPITAFMALYLCYALRRFLALSPATTAALLLLFLVASFVGSSLPCPMPLSGSQSHGPCLNGSLGYAPALLGLLAVGAIAAQRGPEGRNLLIAGAIFSLSLLFRTFDREACSLTVVAGHAWGTHAAWHVLNAVTLHHLLEAALIRYRPRKRGSSSHEA